MDVGCSPWGFGASAITSLHHPDLALSQSFLKSTPNLHRHNNVRMDPYAHSQHIKVFKYFNIYKTLFIYPTWMWDAQSEASFSCNHYITTSLGLSHTPTFQNLVIPHWHSSVRVPPCAVNMLALALKLTKQCL